MALEGSSSQLALASEATKPPGFDKKVSCCEKEKWQFYVPPFHVTDYDDKDSSTTVIFPSFCKFPISGACKIKVIEGSITILGYKLTTETKSVNIFSPSNYSQYQLETSDGVSFDDILKRWPALVDSLCFKQFELYVVVRITKIEDEKHVFGVVKSTAANDSWKLSLPLNDSLNYHPATIEIYKRIGCVIGAGDRPVVDFWKDISSAMESITNLCINYDIETNKSLSRPAVILICGEKNSGKSTTCRALINSLLNLEAFQDKGVGFLECDVGQTEFTPCSVLSWKLIRKPLTEPPFLHMECVNSAETPDKTEFTASFYGDLSPGQSPNRYFECLSNVYSRIPEKAKKNIPLVVNTMGWLQSLGLALLTDTYRLVKPDIVLHLRARNDSSPELSPAFFYSSSGINFSQMPPGSPLSSHVLLDIPVQRVPFNSSRPTPMPPPFVLRNYSTIGHLAGCESSISTSSLSNLPRCSIPAGTPKAIFVGICHERVPPSENIRALLGALVALCRANIYLPPGARDSFIIPLPSGWIGNEWFGLGVILDIDETNKKITVATPLAERPAVLASVNCILRGSVTISSSAINELVPEHLRQNVAPPNLQMQNANQEERGDGPSDAQRFKGRRKRGIIPAS